MRNDERLDRIVKREKRFAGEMRTQLVLERLRERKPDELQRLIREKTGGEPLFPIACDARIADNAAFWRMPAERASGHTDFA